MWSENKTQEGASNNKRSSQVVMRHNENLVTFFHQVESIAYKNTFQLFHDDTESFRVHQGDKNCRQVLFF